MKPNSKILVIAGSDSSGGAGIQADIKTITGTGWVCNDCYYCITSKYYWELRSVIAISREIEKQILFTSKDIKPDGIKIGMLHSTR